MVHHHDLKVNSYSACTLQISIQKCSVKVTTMHNRRVERIIAIAHYEIKGFNSDPVYTSTNLRACDIESGSCMVDNTIICSIVIILYEDISHL